MARYAIGDIQGCFASFKALLQKVEFDPGTDQLFLAGDLVNRGPDSLGTLKWIFKHRKNIQVVLGNHDLHLLGRYYGLRQEKSGDTLNDVLTHPQAGELINWLRSQPVLFQARDFTLVHAGIHPHWNQSKMLQLAAAIHQKLVGSEVEAFLASYFKPRNSSTDKLTEALKAMTLMRIVAADGRIDYQFKAPPGDIPEGYYPWYGHPERKWQGPVIFGHWAAHGLAIEPKQSCLDSGCVWGRQLSALCVESGAVYQVDCQDY